MVNNIICWEHNFFLVAHGTLVAIILEIIIQYYIKCTSYYRIPVRMIQAIYIGIGNAQIRIIIIYKQVSLV